MRFRVFFFSILVWVLPTTAKAEVEPYKQFKEQANRLFHESNYDEAARYFKKALKSCKSCPDTTKINLMLALSKTYSYEDRLEEVYPLLVNAEKLAKMAHSDEYLALTYISFAEYLRKTRAYDKAMSMLEKVDQLIRNQKTSSKVLGEYNNRKAAILSEGFQDFKRAIFYSQKNMELGKHTNNLPLQAISLNELGFAYEHLTPSYYTKSIENYLKSVQLWKAIGDELPHVNALSNLIRVYIKTKQYDLASKYNEEGYQIAKRNGFDYYLIVFTDYQYAIHRNQNNLSKAIEKLEEYLKLNAEFNHKQWSKAIESTENKHELQQKQENQLAVKRLEIFKKELELKKNKESRWYLMIIVTIVSVFSGISLWYAITIKRKNIKLNQVLAENKFLLEESNHRIKNNLQLIIALIHQEMDKQEVDFENSALFEITEKIEAVSSLHKQLYTHKSKEIVRIDTYLNDIKSNFNNFFEKKNVEVAFEVDPMELQINKALYLGILCTELLLNSLKHAFAPEASKNTISLSLTKKNNQILLHYQDSGPGLYSPDAQLKLVDMMSKQMDFSYEIKPESHFNFVADLTGKL